MKQMNHTIRWQTLLSLFLTLAVVVPAVAQDKAYRLWKRMGPVNERYDWLRPPDQAVEAALLKAYGRKPDVDAFQFDYKKELEFNRLGQVYNLTFRTPLTHSAMVANQNRNDFNDKPSGASLAEHFRNRFSITVLVQAGDPSQAPKLAVQAGDRLFRPAHEIDFPPSYGSCDAVSYCWYNHRTFEFLLKGGDRLTGPGSIILRWQGIEKVVPINFDYLW